MSNLENNIKIYPIDHDENINFADVSKFKELINSKNPHIKVVQEDWYK
jgi:hypothetical protein